MGDRYWLWVGARLLVGLAIVAWAGSYIGAGSGEKEFQKTLEAMKNVRSFRVAFSATPVATQHNEALWEVDCDRDLLHHHLHISETEHPPDINQDQTVVAGKEYSRKDDGTWIGVSYGDASGTAKAYCSRLAQGTDSGLLPPIYTMIKRGIIQKGDKKTVNGVRCREWLVTMKGGYNGLEHDTLCLGLEDHLPYQMTVDWEHSRSSFSDYNAPIQIDVPEASVQPASRTATTY